ncbi:HpcH/HpaI aldolase/citrate lyase family protein [Aeromicrobium sp. CTD01-1L150]|uniref:HpcH/HpaI aldolase/citrate lyase family protein n=1 Tax=Aeromicrobium sp. CTD01-1L150 TaxID=3341830 RepID=UPI0035BF7C6A
MSAPRLTWLYVPATRPDRVRKALELDTDAVIVDLEDAVAPADKDAARTALARTLTHTSPTPHLQVRINGPSSPWHHADAEAVAVLTAVESVRLPKVESADDVARVRDRLRKDQVVHPLVETPRAVAALEDLCNAPGVGGVSLGEADLRTAFRSSDPSVMQQVRINLVLASAAAGLPAPMGAAYVNVTDVVGLSADTRSLARQGFLGRTALHPRQLAPIRGAFAPSDAEYAAARQVLASVRDPETDSGAAALQDGTFVDRAVLQRAQQTVDLWNHCHPDASSPKGLP